MTEKKENSAYKFSYAPKQKKTDAERFADLERQMGAQITVATLSAEQQKVFSAIIRWFEVSKNGGVLTLGGYAGVGKSTLISVLASVAPRIVFCALTGKATSVLRKKFYEANVNLGVHEIKTLHSLLYYPVVDELSGVIRGWKRRADLDYDLIIIDEASMVDEKLYADVMSHDIPVLAVGDHGQLPPVMGSFNLMEDPMLKLETIHRQAQNSPILALSEFVRRTGQVPRFEDKSLEVQVLTLGQLPQVVHALFTHKGVRYDDVGLLAYTNRRRVELNALAYDARWGSTANEERLPRVGDQVICLRNTEATVFNGMRGHITELDASLETEFHYYGKILFEDDELTVEGPICKAQFGRETTIKDFNEYEKITDRQVRSWDAVGLLFDWGYALTVHKSQGSAFEHVIVVHDPPSNMSYDMKRRALYTAVTRCSKYLAVLQ